MRTRGRSHGGATGPVRGDQRLVRLDGGLELRHLRFLRIEELRRRKAFLLKRRVAVEIGLGVRELGLVAPAPGPAQSSPPPPVSTAIPVRM
jgi:hypothetical protein